MPWNRLVPDRETIATWPPLLRPNSAVVLPVSTLNSASESGFVRSGAKFEPPALVSLTSMPSSVKFQERSRAPFTWTPPPVLAPDTTPGCVVTSESGLRPARADDGQGLHGLLIDDAAEVPRGAQLHGLGAADDLHGLRERAGFEHGVDGLRLADADHVARGLERLESLAAPP